VGDRLSRTLALQAYHPDVHPRVAAREYEKQHRAVVAPPPPQSSRPAQPQTNRDAWLVAFSEELLRLRPHLSSRMTWSISLQAYRDGGEPKDAAREYHASHESGKVAPARKRTK
jgi:hypothetical protein